MWRKALTTIQRPTKAECANQIAKNKTVNQEEKKKKEEREREVEKRKEIIKKTNKN